MTKTGNYRRLYHYCNTNYESGSFGGVARFDHELRKVFTDIIPITPRDLPISFSEDDIVITDNGMCLGIPENIRCVVVHHGSAITHKKREPAWPGDGFVLQQLKMKSRKNNVYVAPSTFMQKQFFNDLGIESKLISHSSELTSEYQRLGKRFEVLGDWRDNNKGKNVIEQLRNRCPHIYFNQLKCSIEARSKMQAYSTANLYLTLSLSEGCSYSQLDALACNVPVLSTDVSLFGGDCDDRCGSVIGWEDRDNVDLIADRIHEMQNVEYQPREWFDENNSFDSWKEKWKELINDC